MPLLDPTALAALGSIIEALLAAGLHAASLDGWLRSAALAALLSPAWAAGAGLAVFAWGWTMRRGESAAAARLLMRAGSLSAVLFAALTALTGPASLAVAVAWLLSTLAASHALGER